MFALQHMYSWILKMFGSLSEKVGKINIEVKIQEQTHLYSKKHHNCNDRVNDGYKIVVFNLFVLNISVNCSSGNQWKSK